MEKSATAAYENIDKKVSQNLEIARKLLKKLRDDAKMEKSESSKYKRKLPKIPPAMVRCPEDVQCVLTHYVEKKEIEFPESKFRSSGFCKQFKCVKKMKKKSKISHSDELFPPADYETIDNKSVNICKQQFSSVIGNKKESEIINHQFIEIHPSTKPWDLITTLNEKHSSSKHSSSKTKSPNLFPDIPQQLSSERKSSTPRRNKFNALLTIGSRMLDISGIFNQPMLNTNTVEKIVINGNSYSRCK